MSGALGIIQRRAPKLLSAQASDRFAHFVINRSLDAIKKISDNEHLHDREVLAYHIETLKRIKNWYWEEASECLGHKFSMLRYRYILSRSFMDVLDCKKIYRKCGFLERFLIQLLFCCEAGNLDRWPDMRENRQECDRLKLIINVLGPYHIQELHDTCLNFENIDVLKALLSHSSDLKKIHLRYNLSGAFHLLTPFCRNLEVLTIDIENVYDEDHTSLIFSLLEILLGLTINNNLVSGLPFKCLSEVCIRYDRLPRNELLNIMTCLQDSYPNLRTKQTCLLALPYDTIEKKLPFVCPTLLLEKDTKNKQIFMFLRDEMVGECILSFENPEGTSRKMATTSEEFGRSILKVQHEVSQLHLIDSLRYMYCHQGRVFVSIAGGVASNNISELYVFGPLQTNQEVQNFQQVLNMCLNLRVLCLQLRINCFPDMRRLKLLRRLQTLSFSFGMFAPHNMFMPYMGPPPPLQEHINNFLIPLIASAPNLRVLEIPGSCDLQSLLTLKLVFNIHTLSLTDGNVQQLILFIKSLPSLQELNLGREFGYKKFLKLKKTFRCTELLVSFNRARLVSPVTF